MLELAGGGEGRAFQRALERQVKEWGSERGGTGKPRIAFKPVARKYPRPKETDMGNVLSSLNQLKGLRIRSTDRHADHEASWPSAVLHKVAPRMDEGLDTRRIHAMADFIEELEMAPHFRGGVKWASGPTGGIAYISGQTPVRGYVVRDSGQSGMGVVVNDPAETHYYLTGYGLICWGWGASSGMSSVAQNGLVDQLQDVLTARPVWDRAFPDYTISALTCPDIAQALRELVQCRDAMLAWRKVVEARSAPTAGEARSVPSQGQEDPEPVNGAAFHVEQAPSIPKRLTKAEGWKALQMEERYEDLVALCQGEEARLQERMDALEAEMSVWRRRRKAAQVMLEE